MHANLAPHLHTEECNIIISALRKCHKDHPARRFMGACNEINHAVNACLKKELETKRQINLKKGAHKKVGEREKKA